MGLLDSIGGLVTGGGGGLIGDLLGGGAGGLVGDLLGGGIGGEALQIGEGILGQLTGGGQTGGQGSDPLGDVFNVLKGAVGDLLGLGNNGQQPWDLGQAQGGFAGSTPTSTTDGASSSPSGVSDGGGIYDKIFALISKLQDQLNQKMDAASNIDPSNQAGLQKAMFEVQQIQNQMQELVTQATNMLKTQHDTQMSIDRNLA